MIKLKGILYTLTLSFYLVNCFHVNVKRKTHVEVNGTKIHENEIHDHLDEHEKAFLFGKFNAKPNIKLFHVNVSKNISNINNDDDSSDMKGKNKRKKRSTNSNHNNEVLFKFEDNTEQLDLKLHQTPKLIDDAFILIHRYENSSNFIPNSHKLAMDYEKCFYRNENSALDLCDSTAIRGTFHHKSKDFLIHPLPERFAENSHIVFESTKSSIPLSENHENLSKNLKKIDLESLNNFNENFEPKLDEFNNNIHSFKDFNNIKNINKSYLTSQAPETIVVYSKVGNKSLSYSKLKIRDDLRYENERLTAVNERVRRHIASSSSQWKPPHVLHIETAIFVDKDLFKHMAKNFPKNTENHLIRFVLAMINGVQLLYHHPSLGHQINFVLKRLEILHSDPKELRRSSDIDIYLNNFCMWQKKLNPSSDSDAVHYDHAVILTGLDLYVIGKNGKVSSQVVGLAPVAGMCTSTSSCTINEGKHFESVFVVAHEIGHNLGMRHDSNEINCDPTIFIMSPTLGSGKITWSKCSRSYLKAFLETSQAKCMFDRGQFGNSLDHSAEGIFPGERFDADQQCMLKYGKDSVRSRSQILADICRDLHCQRERYTWTSHPALEGTECGEMMWCRSGFCTMKATFMESYSNTKQITINAGKTTDKVSFVDDNKLASLKHEYNFNKLPAWSDWTAPTECESGCLYGSSGRLREGSAGLKIYSRTCLDYKKRCVGKNRKYEACVAKQCYTITKTTIDEFATQICERAKKFDTELIGEGLQIVGDMAEESCKVYCKTKTNSTKSRSWTFPDGTTCKTKIYNFDDSSYCINGRCEKFKCENSTYNFFINDHRFCPKDSGLREDEENRKWNSIQLENARDYKSIKIKSESLVGTKLDSKPKNFQESSATNTINRKSDSYWKYDTSSDPQSSASQSEHLQVYENEWIVKSGCHFSCMDQAKGVQIVSSRRNKTNNIQLCSPRIKPCDKFQTTTQYAKNVCARYKLKVHGLSGYGMQIAPSIQYPDRSCRVACQDQYLQHRFYLVNGEYGLFPFGTKCSPKEDRYCINGKCLEFGANDIPLTQSYISLALFRNKRDLSLTNNENRFRRKRNFLQYNPINITEKITQEFIDNIINKLNFEIKNQIDEDSISNDHIEFTNPIHISINDELIKN